MWFSNILRIWKFEMCVSCWCYLLRKLWLLWLSWIWICWILFGLGFWLLLKGFLIFCIFCCCCGYRLKMVWFWLLICRIVFVMWWLKWLSKIVWVMVRCLRVLWMVSVVLLFGWNVWVGWLLVICLGFIFWISVVGSFSWNFWFEIF